MNTVEKSICVCKENEKNVVLFANHMVDRF